MSDAGLRYRSPWDARLERAAKHLIAIAVVLLLLLFQLLGVLPEIDTRMYRYASIGMIVFLPLAVIELARLIMSFDFEIDRRRVRMATDEGVSRSFRISSIESILVGQAESEGALRITVVTARNPHLEIDVLTEQTAEELAAALQAYHRTVSVNS